MTLGDLHNFGKAVRCETTPDGDTWFEKPRTVFWEHLFFGVKSPLRQFFSKQEIIFGLNVEPIAPTNTGRCLQVKRENLISNNCNYSFGYLLGYSYLFGVQDLFCENLIETCRNIQPIDAEIVLSKFFLPHESSLMPFKTISYERSGLALMKPEAKLISPQNLSEIVDGFIDVLQEATSFSEQIVDSIEREIAGCKVPIRILLRPTSEYRDWQQHIGRYLPEEIDQLSRGDIPYFFKLIGDESIYFFGSIETVDRIKFIPHNMIEPLKNLAVNPSALVSKERIQDFLLPTGCLFLLKHLTQPEFTGEIETERFRAAMSEQSIDVELSKRSFKSRRK